MAKRGTSIYEPGARTGAWLKIKNVMEQEFVVGGYTEGEGSRSEDVRRPARRLLRRRRAAFRVERRLRADGRECSSRSRSGWRSSRRTTSPFVESADDDRRPLGRRQGGAVLLGEAGAGRAGAVQRVDARRQPARARLPRPARRHRSAQRAARRAGRAAGRRDRRRRAQRHGVDRSSARSRRSSSSSRRTTKADFTLDVRRRADQADESRQGVLAGDEGSRRRARSAS